MALEIHLPEVIGDRMLEAPPGAVPGALGGVQPPWRRKIAVIVLGLGPYGRRLVSRHRGRDSRRSAIPATLPVTTGA